MLRSGWIRAAQALRVAHSLTVTGYSFPNTDAATTALVLNELRPTADVAVVDASPEAATRIAGLFGRRRVQTYAGLDAMSQYVDDHAPHHSSGVWNTGRTAPRCPTRLLMTIQWIGKRCCPNWPPSLVPRAGISNSGSHVGSGSVGTV